jgi:NHL repeat
VIRGLVLLLALLVPAAAGADMRLPAGFTATVYVTGRGEAPDGRVAVGIPSTTSLSFDAAGALYAARSGRRYRDGEIEDLWSLLRFPPGGARIANDVTRYFYGPPLLNAQLGAARGQELLVTTFDRDRGLGVLYRLVDGRAELLAGGTPPPREPALFKQPEGVAVDAAGHIYVADRQRGAVVKLDAVGRVLDERWLVVRRPRLVAARDDRVWVSADGDAEAPWMSGTGEVWTVRGQERRVALTGPLVAGMDVGPDGRLFVADRHNARILAVSADGAAVDVVTFGEGDAPRALAWAPVTEATRRAGIAGDLFVVVTRRGAWSVNEIVRISGPFDELSRARPPAR